MVKRLTSKLPSLPAQNVTERYPKYLTKSDELAPKTDSLSGALNGDGMFVHGKTLGDFTKAEVLGNDSVRRVLDFEKMSTSLPPVGSDVNKRLTTGVTETSTTTNVER